MTQGRLFVFICISSVLHSFIIAHHIFSLLSVRGVGELASLRDSYVSSLNSLEEENRQLRLETTELRARMEANNQTWQDKYERALLQNQNKNAQNRYMLLKQTKNHSSQHIL